MVGPHNVISSFYWQLNLIDYNPYDIFSELLQYQCFLLIILCHKKVQNILFNKLTEKNFIIYNF